MKKKINHLDLFSGIGGFHLGFERAGYKVTSFFSEIDKHAIAVYKHQFKNSTYVGSVTDLRGSDLPTIDLLTFGSPCQDFSLAGKRKGMEGERSSLILEAIRLIKECRPRVFIWENVKGTFSSNAGEDFAAILQEFAHIGGYRLEWQLLNTSWFLPQNRERIYLVGYSAEPRRDWRGVFPIAGADEVAAGIKVTAQLTGGQLGRVLDPEGIGYALSACDYKDPMKIEVRSATSQGYEVATEGDSINLSNPNSETRRGRVGKGKAQTLETSCNQAVVDSYRIRRLTPIECERLQGFPDNHTAFGTYDGEVKPMSKTHRYKQCGNAVTVDVVQAVAERLKPVL
jgi:DNA (cytosine-5)-methyltransferase 1